MQNFQCSICGKYHDFYGSMILLPPDILNNMSEEERIDRVDTIFNDKIYLIDGTLLLTKADLYIKIKKLDEFMHWETWVQLNPQEFIKMTQNLGSKDVSTINGKLYLQIPQYKNSLGLLVNLTFFLNGSIDNPEIKFLDEKTELEKDFTKGLTIDKVTKWMEQIYHSSSVARTIRETED